MASGFNITSLNFGGLLNNPLSGRIDERGDVVNESTGTQALITDQKLVRRKVIATVAFDDIDDLATLSGKMGTEDTLVIVIPKATTGVKTATIANAMLTNIVGAGDHAEFGTHVAIFEARSSDGSTNPVVWT